MNNDNYNGVEPTKTAPVATTESMDSLNQEKNDEAGKVTFSKGGGLKSGESVVEINTPPDVVFSGMGKEELSKYANDPFWVRIRWSLFILFWLTWIGMLAAAIIIVVLAPKCSPPPNLNDLQKGSVYEVLTHSFKDGQEEQDGVGDFKGISDRLSHFNSLGVKMVLLAPIFKSLSLTNPDYGYGVIDFNDVDSHLGSLSDFDNLIEAAKKTDVKILLDMIPNHSSDEHPWFVKSAAKEEPYSDYYVWNNTGDATTPPDMTESIFGGSAWTFHPTRQEWYLHRFGVKQPDLNYDNPAVRAEMNSTFNFWLKRGVSGFRLSGVEYIFENDDNQSKLFNLLGDVRQLLRSYEEKDMERTLLTDATGTAPVEAAVAHYGNETSLVPFNFDIIKDIETGFNGLTLNSTISNYLSSVPSWGWPVWVSGSEYKSRLADRVTDAMVDEIAMIQLLLPGTPSIYYGEEIGMHNVKDIETENSCQNASSTYECNMARTPMQWDASANAGFSSSGNGTWLPVAADFNQMNVENETKTHPSHFNVYKKLLNIRQEKAFMHGDTGFPIVDEDILSFTRVRKGSPGYLVVVNGGKSARTLDFTKAAPLISTSSEGEKIVIPSEAKIAVQSVGGNKAYTEGSSVKMDSLLLEPSEGLVIQFVPDFQKV